MPMGNRIKLSFQIFDLGATATGQENCDKVDHVEVRDSFNDDDPGYGTFCGDVAPAPIYSVGPKMVVTFVSDQETIFQGFEARFDAITGGKPYFFPLHKNITMKRILCFAKMVGKSKFDNETLVVLRTD